MSDKQELHAASDPHQQLRIRAAWMYYIAGLTQAEIAKRFGDWLIAHGYPPC